MYSTVVQLELDSAAKATSIAPNDHMMLMWKDNSVDANGDAVWFFSGKDELIVVHKDIVTLDGTECDKIGVWFDAYQCAASFHFVKIPFRQVLEISFVFLSHQCLGPSGISFAPDLRAASESFLHFAFGNLGSFAPWWVVGFSVLL